MHNLLSFIVCTNNVLWLLRLSILYLDFFKNYFSFLVKNRIKEIKCS